MKKFFFPIGVCMLMVFGIFNASSAYAKETQVTAEKTFKESIAFGNPQSPIEIFVFSDWKCLQCRQVEPVILGASEAILKSARLYFIDITSHTESEGIDYTPYNLSFMINNKPQYFKLRKGLLELSATSQDPEEEQIQALAAMNGTKYTPLNYSEITSAERYFKRKKREFEVDTAPTIVIINSFNQKGKKFVGVDKITEADLVDTIKNLRGN